MKIAVVFGGSSNEHEVSVVSAASIIKILNKEKYEITPIYLDKANEFYLWEEDVSIIKPLPIGILPTKLKKIPNPWKVLKTFDLVFIMIHGKNGEDGKISSILEFLNIPYVGNKPSASLITMDKILTKIVLEKNSILTTPYCYFAKYNDEYIYNNECLNYQELKAKLKNYITYPVFVKPANSGSSIGVNKARNDKELDTAIANALEIDYRILIEREIVGREIECGLLEKDGEVISSVLGEVVAADDFYSFDAKYTNKESKTIIPAKLDKKITNEIQRIAITAFKILDCHTYSRCDFFITNNGEILLNEINTIPGFTEISMYPKLFEASGISYSALLDYLIENSIKMHK